MSAAGFFAIAARQIGDLGEVAADDAAIREHRLTLAGALLAVATAQVPAGALALGGTGAAQRIRRLVDPPAQPSRASAHTTLAAMSILAVAPRAVRHPGLVAG